MSYWVELQCDVKAAGSNVYNEPGCWTHRNESVGLLFNTLSTATGELREVAYKKHWKKIKRGWACPYCKGITK